MRTRTESLGKYQRTYSDFLILERALSSNDLGAARHAFAQLVEDAPPLAKALSSDPFPQESVRLLAFKELERCLRTGHLAGAIAAAQRFQE